MIGVGLSGGIDSAFTARELLSRGEKVLGLFLELHDDKGIEAQKRADELKIKLEIIDARKEFQKQVIDVFQSEYAIGRTPNPCLYCNREIKFGLLLEAAKKLGCEKIATGHYAQIKENRVWKAVDKKKDQSYAFALVKKEALPFIELPLGKKNKLEVKREANWKGGESQDLCFASSRLDALKHLPHKKGVFIHDGVEVGEHEGAWFYCIGQRRGFGNKRLYVKNVDVKNNSVELVERDGLYCESFTIIETNLHGELPAEIDLIVRHKQQPLRARVDGNIITPIDPLWSPSRGQVAGFYDGDLLVGGAIINSIKWKKK